MTKLRIGNKALIKDMNRSVVINTIRKEGPLSRTDLSNLTGLGLSTITKIIDELLTNHLVYETGSATSTGGRRPILIEFNQKSGYAIGIKIMQDHLVVALTDLEPSIIESFEVLFESKDDSDSIIHLINSSIQKILQQQNIDTDNVEGIGIAVSGLVDSMRGIVVRSSLLGWEDVNLSHPIQKEFKVPILVDNDVNAYTYAEIEQGFGTFQNNFICISIGDGIGASIVIDKKLYKGEFGGAGEFGHTIIQVGGRQCHCGLKGCLEMYASSKGLEAEAASLSHEYPNSRLLQQPMNMEMVLMEAEKGDELAKVLLAKLGDYVGIGLINAINSFNPGTIVLIGEGIVAKDYFVPQAVQRAKENFFYHARYDTSVVTSTLGNDAWVKGASILAINQLFQPPIYELQK